MTHKIRSTSKRSPTIISTSRRARTIDKAEVAKAIGAEKVHEAVSGLRGSPPALFGLRRELQRRLRSTGGRPSLEGASRRQKIPLSDEDWKRLEKVAAASRDDEFSPTPGQVASVLLSVILQDMEEKICR
jgi:hypothetical protein